MKSSPCIEVFLSLVLPLAVVRAADNGPDPYFVAKAQAFLQNANSGPIPDPNTPFIFSVSAPTAVTLTLPGGATRVVPFIPGDNEYGLHPSFGTKAALDTAFPNGTYRLTGTGIPTLSFDLTTDAYPAGTPAVTNGNFTGGGVHVVNPAQSNTINFSSFTTYGSGPSHMQFKINGLTDGVNLRNDILSVAAFGQTATPTAFTSFTIPAGALTSGRAYEATLQWDAVTTLDQTITPNGAVALMQKYLTFYIGAQAAGTNTPTVLIAGQPQNQTAVLGGRATFTIGFTVGGVANQFNNLGVQWYFNGVPIFMGNPNDPTAKYVPTGPGAGLQINNVTAADAGVYGARLINAGGVAISNSATLTIGTSAAPAFTVQPQTQTLTVATNSTVVLTATATGTPTPTYQWQRDGTNIPGASSATLVLSGNSGPLATLSGSYRVVANNGTGGPVTSNATPLNVIVAPNPGRLINLSILTQLAASETMTMGTVLGGGGTSGNKALLARAAGPALTQLGLGGVLPDPTMILSNTSASPAVTVANNNDWGGTTALTAAFAAVGAFPYAAANSKDAAIFQSSLAAGNYTVQVSDASGGAGTVIAELYDSTPSDSFTPSTPRLVNVSVLKQISSSLTVGFVIGGTTSKTVLVRAIGPTLGSAPFNISGVMPDPTLTLVNISATPNVTVATNNDWGGDSQISAAANRVGAFAVFNGSSKDAMLLLTLAPGNYTAQVAPASGTAGGTAIVEVYEVP